MIKDLIKSGIINYKIGDEVIVWRRKGNGYPKSLKDETVYKIVGILSDGHLYIKEKSKSFTLPIKIHKSYMISKLDLRNLKLKQILE
jgi:hypothetical protein